MSISVNISKGSTVIGKKVGAIEKDFKIKIKQLENFSDRILPFPWEKLPHNKKIKEGDTLTVIGNDKEVISFYKYATQN